MPALRTYRLLFISGSLAGFVAVTAAFHLVEVPGLGVGHFYYIPVALMALATNRKVGALAGLAASGLYLTSVILNPHTPDAGILAGLTAIRLVTFVSTGALIGWFASNKLALVTELRDLAERDHLTGLLNTRAFESSLATRCQGSRRFALLVGDLDGLKRVNDERGHPAGNHLLRLLGRTLVNILRAEDEVARVGGDEFAVLTTIATPGEAEVLCRRLERQLDERGVRTSFGWSFFPMDGDSPAALHRCADRRLYASKVGRASATRPLSRV